ncbi:MAG: glycosyltransferase [Bacteroidales bacterium]|nr:glycosyltransferase [Bacteroidales bacterium]
MLSVIICSRAADIPEAQRRNIEATVGCGHEIVVIDNSQGRYSIFQAYNEGVRRAKGDLLCFMHDDVVFATDGWGGRIARHFDDPAVGVVGFGGAHFVPDAPLYWTELPFVSEHCRNDDGHGTLTDCVCTDYFRGGLADVVVVDGFCMVVRASLFGQISFDEKTYAGFHAYDMDLCMQVVALGGRVCVCRDVMPVHTWSEAMAGRKKGMELLRPNMRLFQQKWSHMLPLWRGMELQPQAARRLDGLCRRAADSYAARHSAAYRLGSAVVRPVKRLLGRCGR